MDIFCNENYFVFFNFCLKKLILSEDEGNIRYSWIFFVIVILMIMLILYFYDNVILV